ncbi:cation:dicarboxylase symporter family transporter [Aquidulcibacter sp.]|uniref:dicarboxylate/amino acid:cation symporter n=1 Tax=Aquidulcibacter sp. TaxID=2052990 RepID=UPI0025BB253C|nr:cation:dicarboxylase symporter family transporter [Aquidulcibacter sp.]MCA3691728.1 cation:dicarboxylase symporter family transporter [Aquidulcibacter sp.]
MADAALSTAPRPQNFFERWQGLLPLACVLSLVLGFATGGFLASMGESAGTQATIAFFDVVGTMWINAIRMTIIPLIVPLLIGAIAGAENGRSAGNISLQTLIGFFLICICFAGLAALSTQFVFSGLSLDQGITDKLRASVQAAEVPTGDASIATWFKNLIPINPIKAAADGTMLSLMIFAIAFGFASLIAPPEVRSQIVSTCRTISSVMLLLVQGVLLVAPLGIFGLTLVVGTKLGGEAFTALGYFITVHVSAALVFSLGLLAGLAIWGNLALSKLLIGVSNPVSVALGTSSSLSALPAMIETARDVWRLPERVYGFVLPFAVSTFKPSTAYAWVFSTYFLSLLYGTPFGPQEIAFAAAYAAIFNATVPGIPGGGMIAVAPLLLALGLPLEGLAILFAVNPITDRTATTINVLANLTVTAFLAKLQKPAFIESSEV